MLIRTFGLIKASLKGPQYKIFLETWQLTPKPKILMSNTSLKVKYVI